MKSKEVEGDYFCDAVLWAVEKGITSGTDASHFSPDAACTRAQTITFLWRAAGSPEPEGEDISFTDVEEDSYYYKAVLWAAENGITEGTSAAAFGPDATVTRAETVTFLWRCNGKPSVSAENVFTDVASDSYCYNAVLWAVNKEITTGTSKTTFSPDDYCLRSQIVTFIYRAAA